MWFYISAILSSIAGDFRLRLVDWRRLGARLVCRAQAWALEGSRVTEHPVNLPSLPSDKWPQHELFISSLEKWTVPPLLLLLLGLSSTPPHVSKCDNSLICQEQRRVRSLRVFLPVPNACVAIQAGEFWEHIWDKLLKLLMLRPVSIHSLPPALLFAALCFFGSKAPLVEFT